MKVLLKVVQVNLCQKLSFLNLLTHNLTRLLIESPEKYKFRTCYVQILFWMSKQKQKNNFCTQYVLNLYFSGEFNEQSLILLWINWFKNEGFWKKRDTMFGPSYFDRALKIITWISLGKVALNISVCLFPVTGILSCSTILRIWGSKPMSNIRSASSRTRYL